MQWSVEKQQRLAAQLTGYWGADVWKIADCPLVKAERMLRKYPNAAIDFSLLSPGLRRELKYVCAPMTILTPASFIPWRSSRPITSPHCAPNARQIPISCLRWVAA